MKLDKENKLNSEELEQVAGGHCGDSIADMRRAYERQMPGFENMDPNSLATMAYCLENWDKVVDQLKNMFAQYGIEMTYYSDQPKTISICTKVGGLLTDKRGKSSTAKETLFIENLRKNPPAFRRGDFFCRDYYESLSPIFSKFPPSRCQA